MAAEGALDIFLHPLVVLSIADHYTRTISQNPKGPRRCLGLLFGEQDGRAVRIFETVEMAFEETTKGQPQIVTEAVETDMKLFSEAYANYECLGWYSSGTEILPYDSVLHTQFKKYNERPLFVLMNPSLVSDGMRDLPLTIYEEVIHVVNDKTTSEFVKTAYVVQADEAERITVTYCAKVVNQEESGSAVVSHYTTMLKSVQSLRDRVGVLHQFLCDVRIGKVDLQSTGDQQILRDIKGLCMRLPVMEEDKFRSELLAEYNDALLVTYLSSLTKGTHLLSDVQTKFAVSHREETRIGLGPGDRRRHGGHMIEEDATDMADRRRRRGGDGGFLSGVLGSLGVNM